MRAVTWMNRLLAFLAVVPAALVVFFWLRSYLPGDLNIRSQSGRLYLFFTQGNTTYDVDPTPNPQATAASQTPKDSWKALELSPPPAQVTRLYLPGAWYISYGG